jgi:hypothetical protein
MNKAILLFGLVCLNIIMWIIVAMIIWKSTLTDRITYVGSI